ncbi:MAG TPA: aconitate hydratase AcnA [Candidatus Limnocylindrales bacterium]
MSASDPFGARASLGPGFPDIYRLSTLERGGAGAGPILGVDLGRMPVTVKILLENVLRHAGGGIVRESDVATLAGWRPGASASGTEIEIPFMPARVIMQDFTGVPAVVDLAAMRDAMADLGGDPARVNPLVPADLVIDHSVQVDRYGTADSFAFNVGREYERNGERYQLLRWAQTAFGDLRVVPPGTGIVHQVNLEFLATVVARRRAADGRGEIAFPDTLVGTDSHTTMINGLGVLGYGVGGIEAEAVLLGQPLYQPMPKVIGVRLSGELPEGATATDLVLVVTQMLRSYGVVGTFVEFGGDGLAGLALADRATISNMSPEFGATATLFPIDGETLAYLRLTGRADEHIDLVERYAKEQGLWREPGLTPDFDVLLTLDLGSVEPSLAGPRRPQDRVALRDLRSSFRSAYPPSIVASAAAAADAGGFAASIEEAPYPAVRVEAGGRSVEIASGSVAIAAITSCTNTSNPTVMVAAGLLARNAVARGLAVPPTVKTSLAPGSRAVTEYLRGAELLEPLEKLGFALAGYGCTTCIGNSGPLDAPVAEAIEENDLVVAAVLSGNRNFEGRIHPLVRASYLASPPLVVAFALAGTVDIDLTREPLGRDRAGAPVFLADLWPSAREVRETVGSAVDGELFRAAYASVFDGDARWRALDVPTGDRYRWDAGSTYVARPPFFEGLAIEPPAVGAIEGARVLCAFGDSVTTDHISPAGSISPGSPAGQWLLAHGVGALEFNSYGARRGHHEVMMRGTFGNIRLRNALAGREGPYTVHLPSGEPSTVFDAAMRYAAEGVPLLVIAGKEYGSGSSRDWAAKGPRLLGVRAVIAESFERIHRSNLVGMGILPLQFLASESAAALGLTGREAYTIEIPEGGLIPRGRIWVVARADGEAGADDAAPALRFEAIVRLDGPIELDYYLQGGILAAVLRRLARESTGS